jgi:hypothetical protein
MFFSQLTSQAQYSIGHGRVKQGMVDHFGE